MSPATQRSSVDLPEPDLPSRATISPSERAKLTPSSTGRAWPSGVVNVLVTDSASMITVPVRVTVSLLTIESSSVSAGQTTRVAGSQRVPPFGQSVQPAPEQPVGQDHVDAHHRDADQDFREVPRRGRLGDVGAESGGGQVMGAVGYDFGDDGSVPRAARGGDPAGDVAGEDRGQDEILPAQPAPHT